jgi:hypothetical protein
VFNKVGDEGFQVTITVHVDDQFVTCVDSGEIDKLHEQLVHKYKEVAIKRGPVLDYVGMTFDFSIAGEVSVTMENCVNDILAGCGVDIERATPAASSLFEVRDAPKLNADDAAFFHTHVAKMLYLAKRVRSECLTAVSFLSTRVHECDIATWRS